MSEPQVPRSLPNFGFFILAVSVMRAKLYTSSNSLFSSWISLVERSIAPEVSWMFRQAGWKCDIDIQEKYMISVSRPKGQ